MENDQTPQPKTTYKILDNTVDVEFFDPPMCCPTGICGPTIDQDLLDVNEMVKDLKDKGYLVERYQMTSHPAKFTGNPEVMALIRQKQMAALPIILLRGKIYADGYYPKGEALQEQLKKAN